MRKKLLEEREKAFFFARHGITLNKETIWLTVKRFDMVAQSVRKRYGLPMSSSKEPEQLSLSLKSVSSWPFKG